MSKLSEPGCKSCEASASGVCTKHNEHGRGMANQQPAETRGEGLLEFKAWLYGGMRTADEIIGRVTALAQPSPAAQGEPECALCREVIKRCSDDACPNGGWIHVNRNSHFCASGERAVAGESSITMPFARYQERLVAAAENGRQGALEEAAQVVELWKIDTEHQPEKCDVCALAKTMALQIRALATPAPQVAVIGPDQDPVPDPLKQ